MYLVTAHGQSSLILGLVSSTYLLCVIYVYPHLIITCNLLPNLALSTKIYNSLILSAHLVTKKLSRQISFQNSFKTFSLSSLLSPNFHLFFLDCLLGRSFLRNNRNNNIRRYYRRSVRNRNRRRN